MNFSKTEQDRIDKLMIELNNCGDTYCVNTITSDQIETEGLKNLKGATKKCHSKKKSKTKKELLLQNKKYNACFKKYYSKYAKKLTKRKKCEDKKCSIIQKELASLLHTKKI